MGRAPLPRLFERNLEADIKAVEPNNSLTAIHGIELRHHKVSLDDLRLTNCLTSEHNVLGPGAIGHIVRSRAMSGTGDYGAVDTYIHYDQVGSVVATSNAAGTGTSVLYADAFGNPLANWESGLWGEPSGWRHNIV